MASVNKVILIGNLGADPELRATSAGDSVCTMRLATTDKWKDKTNGEVRETTEWHRVVLFRRLAEVARDYLMKGSLVYIEGRIRTRKWQTTIISVQVFNRPIGKGLRAIGSEFVMEFVLVAFGHQNELSIWYGSSNPLNGH